MQYPRAILVVLLRNGPCIIGRAPAVTWTTQTTLQVIVHGKEMSEAPLLGSPGTKDLISRVHPTAIIRRYDTIHHK